MIPSNMCRYLSVADMAEATCTTCGSTTAIRDVDDDPELDPEPAVSIMLVISVVMLRARSDHSSSSLTCTREHHRRVHQSA